MTDTINTKEQQNKEITHLVYVRDFCDSHRDELDDDTVGCDCYLDGKHIGTIEMKEKETRPKMQERIIQLYFDALNIKHKVTVEHDDYTCGDGCCYNWWAEICINGFGSQRCDDSDNDVVWVALGLVGIKNEYDEDLAERLGDI